MKRSILCLIIILAGTVPAIAAEQSTTGWCSPIQSGNNNTFVCNGVDPRAMKRLNDLLDQRDLTLQQKTAEANEWARRYLFSGRPARGWLPSCAATLWARACSLDVTQTLARAPVRTSPC